jgi:hypothetical protein
VNAEEFACSKTLFTEKEVIDRIDTPEVELLLKTDCEHILNELKDRSWSQELKTFDIIIYAKNLLALRKEVTDKVPLLRQARDSYDQSSKTPRS